MENFPVFNSFEEYLQCLDKTFGEINTHPKIDSLLEEYEGNKYLPCSNILNEHVEAPDDFKVLMSLLMHLLEGCLISSEGQHSDYYFKIQKNGYSARVTERDSFGPLGCAVRKHDMDWTVCYG